jgi:hypothetical protein
LGRESPPLVTKLTNGYFFEAPRGFTVYDVSSESECRLILKLIWSFQRIAVIRIRGGSTQLLRSVFVPYCVATNTSLPEWIKQSWRFAGRLAKHTGQRLQPQLMDDSFLPLFNYPPR